MGKSFSAGLLLLLLPAVGCAEEDPNLLTSYFGEFPVVLSASRLVQPAAQAPVAVTVIDREQIASSGARQIVEVFRLVPGAVVGYARGNWPVVSLRGMTGYYSNQLQVLIDGVSVYSPMWGGVEWSDLPLSVQDIERIEVIRSPNAASWGANSYAGIINIITRDPATDGKARVSANLGERGLADEDVRGTLRGDGWRMRVSAGQRFDRGLETRYDDQRVNYAGVRGDLQLSGRDTVLVNYRYSSGGAQQGDVHNTDPLSVQQAHGSSFETHLAQVRLTHAASANEETWVQYYHYQRRYREDVMLTLPAVLMFIIGKPPVDTPFPTHLNYDVRRDGIEFQQTRTFGDSLRTVWGYEWREDSATSENYFGRPEARISRMHRLFANGEWRFADRWTFQPGAMWEHDDLGGSSWAPRLALTVEPFANHVFRLSTTRASRSPSFYEKYADAAYRYQGILLKQASLASSSVINPESVSATEAAYSFKIQPWRLSGQARWFNERRDNFIEGYQRPFMGNAPGLGFQTGDFQNINHAHVTGGDLELDWRPQDGTRLGLALARTVINATVEPPSKMNYGRSAPLHTVSLTLTQSLPSDMEIWASYSRVGAMQWLSTNDTRDYLPPYERLDMRLSRKVRWGGQQGEFAWVTQNMLKRYLDFQSQITPLNANTPFNFNGRTSYLQFSLEI